MRISLLLLAAAATLAAQPGFLKLPTLGFVYDAEAKAIRPIRGVAGAAVLGDAVNAAIPLDQVAMSPSHDYALIAVKHDCCWRLMEIESGRATELRDGGVAPADSLVAFSPTGASAVLSGSDEVRVISRLPEAPRVRRLNVPVGGRWTAMAVSDDGRALLLASGDDVWLVIDDWSRRLSVSEPVTAMAFRAGGQDAIAITRGGEVVFIESGGAVRQALPADKRAADPLGVQLAPDGRRAYAATRSGLLLILDLATGSITATPCGCLPSSLAPLKEEGMFRITDLSAGPPLLFDARGVVPRVWFVPAVQAGLSQGRDQ